MGDRKEFNTLGSLPGWSQPADPDDSIVPSVDNGTDIGSPTHRVRNIYATGLLGAASLPEDPLGAVHGGTGADTSGADDGDVLTFDDASGTYLPVAPAGGGAAAVIVTKAFADTPYALAAGDTTVLANTVDGNLTVTLPAAPVAGRIVNIKKIHAANTLTINGNGKTIDGAVTAEVTTNYVNYQLQYTGTEWSVL